MLLAQTRPLVIRVDVQISSPHYTFTDEQTEALNLSKVNNSSGFPRILPVLERQVLDPRSPVRPGQTGTVGHLKVK